MKIFLMILGVLFLLGILIASSLTAGATIIIAVISFLSLVLHILSFLIS